MHTGTKRHGIFLDKLCLKVFKDSLIDSLFEDLGRWNLGNYFITINYICTKLLIF